MLCPCTADRFALGRGVVVEHACWRSRRRPHTHHKSHSLGAMEIRDDASLPPFVEWHAQIECRGESRTWARQTCAQCRSVHAGWIARRNARHARAVGLGVFRAQLPLHESFSVQCLHAAGNLHHQLPAPLDKAACLHELIRRQGELQPQDLPTHYHGLDRKALPRLSEQCPFLRADGEVS